MNEKLSFKQWLSETEAIYDPKAKGTFNWWGAPGSSGKSIEGDPIKNWTKKKPKRKKKK